MNEEPPTPADQLALAAALVLGAFIVALAVWKAWELLT